MKRLLMMLTIAFFATACDGGVADKSHLTPEQTNKMKAREFDAQVKLEISDGQLKGDYIFKLNPDVNAQMLQISVTNGPGYKDDITKRGTLLVLSVVEKESEVTLHRLEKEFMGMIKEGSYPGFKKGNKSSTSIVIKNKNKNSAWAKAEGKLISLNDITLTAVGEWVPIRGKREVRRVEGSFTDQVEFEYYDSKSLLKVETVEIKVTFSTVQSYSPMFSDTAK